MVENLSHAYVVSYRYITACDVFYHHTTILQATNTEVRSMGMRSMGMRSMGMRLRKFCVSGWLNLGHSWKCSLKCMSVWSTPAGTCRQIAGR